jgi:hypothetical protein
VVVVSVVNDVFVIVVAASDWELDTGRVDEEAEGGVLSDEVGRTDDWLDEDVDEGLLDEDAKVADDGKEGGDWPLGNHKFPVAVVPFHITGHAGALSETVGVVQIRRSFFPRTAKPLLGTCDLVIISLSSRAPATLTVKARAWIVTWMAQ